MGIGGGLAGKGNGGRRDEQAVAEDGETYLPSVESSVDARTRTRAHHRSSHPHSSHFCAENFVGSS